MTSIAGGISASGDERKLLKACRNASRGIINRREMCMLTCPSVRAVINILHASGNHYEREGVREEWQSTMILIRVAMRASLRTFHEAARARDNRYLASMPCCVE